LGKFFDNIGVFISKIEERASRGAFTGYFCFIFKEFSDSFQNGSGFVEFYCIIVRNSMSGGVKEECETGKSS
jgi:hypothetical protein